MMSFPPSTPNKNSTSDSPPLTSQTDQSCAPSHHTDATLSATTGGHEARHTTSAAPHTGPPIPPVPAPSSNFNSTDPGPAHTDQSGPNNDVEEFEMAPIDPEGSRRLRTTLADTATGTATPSSSRRRSPRPGSLRQGTGFDGANDSEQDSLSDEGKDPYDFSDEDLHDDEEAGLTGSDRRRKRKKRARNTQLDQRIVREREIITTEEIKEADKSVIKRLLINLALIGLWYFFSLSISLVSSTRCSVVRMQLLTPFSSIINGCLIPGSSTSPSLFLQLPHTC